MTAKQVELVHADVTRSIIGAFFYVFNTLRFGFLESVYAAALTKVLRDRGHVVEREVAVRVWFEGEAIALQRLDMLVDGKVIIEIKSGDRMPVAAREQLSNYLRATKLEIGLVLHFGTRPTIVRQFNPSATHSSN